MDTITTKTLRELLPDFYEKYNLQTDGGLKDNKVKIEVTSGFYFYIPNWENRRKALLKHDIHHIITAYHSDFKGETEISSWEIASGCNNYWAAWLLDTYGMLGGVWFNLPDIYKAFVRGRKSKNLYADILSVDEFLDMSVCELQNVLHIPSIDEQLNPELTDFIAFLGWLIAGGFFSLSSLLLLPVVVVYNLYLAATRKF